MSHFYTIALLSEAEISRCIEALYEMLSPYDENLEVEGYVKECWCVGEQAKEESDARAAQFMEKTTGKTLETLRTEYSEMIAVKYDDRSALGEYPTWQDFSEEWVSEYRRVAESFFNVHPKKETPTTQCQVCYGEGSYISQYNPDSKWDWWVVGGRWSDTFESVPNAGETFTKVKELIQKQNNSAFTDVGDDLRNNIATVEDLLTLNEETFEDVAMPFAVVTEDGWYESGKMGWWGQVRDGEDSDTWVENVKNIYQNNRDKFAVVLDLHI